MDEMGDLVSLAGALLFGFGIPILVVRVVRREQRVRSALRQRGIRTTGHVVDVWTEGSGESASTYSRIEFRDAQGVRRSFDKSGDDHKGKKVVVVYDRDHPEMARITDRTGIRRTNWLMENVFFAIVGGLLWLASLAFVISHAISE